MNDYVHIEAADLRRPNARFTTERQGYQVLTPFGKLGYSQFLDHVLFWNARDLERKLADFHAYYNAARIHASQAGNTPLGVAVGSTVARVDLSDVRWASDCRGLVQLPKAA